MIFVRLRVRIPLLIVILALSVSIVSSRSAPALQESSRSQPTSAVENLIDINSAPLEQLLKVPGMTRTWAARIIRFRPYRAKNELLDRGVVTSQVYDRIKDHIIAHRPRN